MSDVFTDGEMFILEWQYPEAMNPSHYKMKLAQLMVYSDSAHLDRIGKGFPVETAAFKSYRHERGWWKGVQERAMKAGLIPEGAW